MARFPACRAPRSAPHRRPGASAAALAAAMLLVLSSCASLTDSLAGAPRDERARDGTVIGWALFHAVADQWQVEFSLQKLGPPWMVPVSMVEHLRPGAKAPRYRGELPLNTLIAPAAPTDVAPGGEYGWRVAPDLGTEELHNGTDIGAAHGSDVVAAMEGVVRAVFWDVWGGNRVEVAHAANMVSTYNHLDEVLVEPGEKLAASQKLGTVGQTGSRVTGPHLHFETWIDGAAVDPQSFDWITGDRIIPAPHDHARNPPIIPANGPGDNSSVDDRKTCPYEDPGRCRPPDPDPAPLEDCPAAPVPGARTDCPPPEWPALSSQQCLPITPGVLDCVPLAPVPGTAPGPEDCPAAPVPGARTDCPAAPPDLSDPQQCRSTELGTVDCVPFAPVPGTAPGPEDCPAAPVPGARTDCPPLEWPALSSQQCLPVTPGVFDCVPLAPVPGTAPGPEDCPAAPVPEARTDCPPAPPERTDPGGRLPAPPADIEVVPPFRSEAALPERRRGRGRAGQGPPDPDRRAAPGGGWGEGRGHRRGGSRAPRPAHPRPSGTERPQRRHTSTVETVAERTAR